MNTQPTELRVMRVIAGQVYLFLPPKDYDYHISNGRRMVSCARRWRERGDMRAAALYLNKAARHRKKAMRAAH